ncbi:MAG: hypothetical protein P1V97_15010 [Planctomycetota bacterium]|nr:hypothetical protein [Planctomycetota bacterium]
MQAKTASKYMWILMGVVLLAFLGLKNSMSSKDFRKFAQKKRSAQVQYESILDGIKNFAEFEGLHPESMADLRDYTVLGFAESKHWRFQGGSSTIFLQLDSEEDGTSIAVRLTFKPRLMIADIGEFIEHPNGRGRKFQINTTKEYKLNPKDDYVSKRTRNRLMTRLISGTEYDCREVVAYFHRKKSLPDAFSSVNHMIGRFPRSHWVSVAKAHMMLDRPRPNTQEFSNISRRQASHYGEWFYASRLYLPKKEFYEFAKEMLPRVPIAVRDRCFEHVVRAAYRARDFKTAIKFCEQWKSKASAEYYSASLLSAGSPKTARFIYEKYTGPIKEEKPVTELEDAILRGNILYALPDSRTKAYPFFPELSDFLIFPNLN